MNDYHARPYRPQKVGSHKGVKVDGLLAQRRV